MLLLLLLSCKGLLLNKSLLLLLNGQVVLVQLLDLLICESSVLQGGLMLRGGEQLVLISLQLLYRLQAKAICVAKHCRLLYIVSLLLRRSFLLGRVWLMQARYGCASSALWGLLRCAVAGVCHA